jgi:hypothetical protein
MYPRADPSGNSTRNLMPRGHEDDLTGRHVEHTELGVHRECACLRDDQQLAVSVVKEPVRHRPVGGVDVNGRTGLDRRIPVAAKRHDAIDEVRRLGRNRKRPPAQLIRGRRDLVERTASDQAVRDRFEWFVHG